MFSNILTCNFWTFFFCAWGVFLVRLLHRSYCWEQKCPGTGSLSLRCLRPASSIELLQMSFLLTFWKIKHHQQAEKLLNEQRAFIHLNGLSNKKTWGEKKADPIWDRMGKYFLPECISKPFCSHRQQIYDNIWAERAEGYIKVDWRTSNCSRYGQFQLRRLSRVNGIWQFIVCCF